MKVKKGDTVVVIAGKDKGAKGKVIQSYPERGKILVEGVNRIKKHTRVTQTQRGAQSAFGDFHKIKETRVSSVSQLADDRFDW